MADVREAILARIMEVIADVDGIETASRNLDELDDAKLPAIILYDGDEEAAENLRARGLAPNVMNMLPAIVLSLGDVPENVGTTANGWRAKLLSGLLGDAQIVALCGKIPNAGIHYLGCVTSLNPGRASQVAMTFNISIAYSFKPMEL